MTSTQNSRRSRRIGFTLIELLVVVAIISILMGVLLPSLGTAREAARSLTCLSMVRQLAMGQNSYAAGSDNYIPGVWTSGFTKSAAEAEAKWAGNKSSSTPTSSHDWISPSIGEEVGLSPNRAQRTWEIFERLACASAVETNKDLFSGSRPSDFNDFRDVVTNKGEFRQISYLAPSGFHYRNPQALAPGELTPGGGLLNAREAFQSPRSYFPRLERVGAPSAKVAVVDGTRFLDYRNSGRGGVAPTLDFDVDLRPQWYGSFNASSPVFHASREFGRALGNAGGRDVHIRMSMRHPGLRMNAAFFDGHAESIQSTRAWSDPSLWYPRGSVFNQPGDATPEVREAYQVGQAIN